ncbi:hypothetical protein IP92_02114 [Pseudoduganella flava]|uniref:DUF4410 domain-containing protein n=1 Tax=Pseudoduganella flava TaxID=871742 RepID=A0A562PW92_9BURK|nr:hypothetical protein [Pseudoduganella flava]QGZ39803.1 hypothetical protein GO485_12570 [Pseudoduganella flava]TWI48722.1 hypothetical protein IP92_02114 [Pseudoduganella flava]
MKIIALLKRFSIVAALAGTTLLTGCATTYVDTMTKEVAASEYRKPTQAKPVTVSFEFQTNGAPNSRATEFLKAQVTDQLENSGLFATASGTPGAGQLQVVLNNVPLQGQNAAAAGFVTGLTFGAVGSTVTDGYVCTISYLPPGQAQPVKVSARHAIHTTMGASSAPANAQESPSMEAAVRKMTRDVVSTALRDLSNSPNFN